MTAVRLPHPSVVTLAALGALVLFVIPIVEAQDDANISSMANFTTMNDSSVTNSTDGTDIDHCYTKPCINGVCENTKGNYTCICPPNYNGTRCENDLANMYGCAIEPCQNQGTCEDLPEADQSGRRFKCTCPDGYTGVICETMIDLCRTNPCDHGSTCTKGLNSYTCNCTGTGYQGINCSEDVNECNGTTNPCGDVRCFNQPGSFTCECPAGFDGSPCVQVNECVTRPCRNGGTCVDGLDTFTCLCPEGYTGQRCEDNIDECVKDACPFNNSRCKDLINNFTCECDEGFSGDPVKGGCGDINECDPAPYGQCQNEAACENQIGSYVCTCRPGFTGKDCETNIDDCDPDPCQNNATCLDGDDTYICDCLPGYSGPECENDIDECIGNDCKHGANCTNLINAYRCECVPGWTGDKCELNINECSPNPCFNGGECEDRINAFYCDCPLGFTGVDCSTNINDCNPDPCQNNGTCLDSVNEYICDCHPDWMGQNCTEVYDECTFKQPCKNGGNCTSEPRVHEFKCSCPVGFEGPACEINIDDCALAGSGACPSYQECRDGVNEFTCACPIGYGGFECKEDIDECNANPCQNGGTCTDGRGNYTCTCQQTVIDISRIIGPEGVFTTGYTGQNCEQDINECNFDPPICQSGGICRNSPGAFTCYCPTQPVEGNTFLAGTLCESSSTYCDIRKPDEQCLNGATCENIPQGSECRCVPGYEGDRCEFDINECLPKPCKNNGTCHDRINGYECTCQPGWTGLQCEINIDDCQSDPCRNKGICQDGINSFTCNCMDTGFEGDICENNIDDCVDSPCDNGGTCEDRVKGYTCDCLPAYDGLRCETDIPDCNPSPCLHGSTCKERSNQDLYGKGDPEFVTFTYAGAAGYVCECAAGVKGVNCSEDIDECEDLTLCKNGATCVNNFQSFSCACVPGYTGQFCETEIDECQVYQPCKNGGECTDLINEYSCSCPAPTVQGDSYGGQNCTTYLSGCNAARQCGPGDCLPQLISETPLVHDFLCMCPPGYSGRRCELTTDFSFLHSATDGYFRNDMSAMDGEVSISLNFRTTLPNALLILCEVPLAKNEQPFVSVELVGGRVQMRYRLPLSILAEIVILDRVVTVDTVSKVNDGKYHNLAFTFSQSTLRITLPSEKCTTLGSGNETCVKTVPLEQQLQTQVTSLYIGSKENSQVPSDFGLGERYIGCMQDVMLNGKWIYPGQQTGDYYNLVPGCYRQEQCLPGVCSNQGDCQDLWDKFGCLCHRPYRGDICTEEYPAATFMPGSASFTRSVTVGNTKDLDNMEISFFLTTRQTDSFLAYYSRDEPDFSNFNSEGKPEQFNFMGLYLKDGKLAGEFVNCGNLLEFDTSTILSAMGLYDGLPHLVEIVTKSEKFHLLVDNVLLFQSVSTPNSEAHCTKKPTTTLVLDTLRIGTPTDSQNSRRKRDLTGLSRWKRQASTNTNDQYILMYQNMTKFQGVIQDIRANNQNLDFDFEPNSGVVSGKQNTESACTILSPCVQDQYISCNDTYFNDYVCICKFGYRGKNCSEPDFCSYSTCPEESSCVNLQNGYECVGVATFFQSSSLITYKMSEDLIRKSDGSDLDLTFVMRTRGMYGLIFQMHQGPYYVSLRVARGHLEVNYKLEEGEYVFSTSVGTLKEEKVNDGKWHYVRFQVTNSTSFQLKVYAGTHENPTVDVSQPHLQLLDETGTVQFSTVDSEVNIPAMLLAAGNGSELLVGGSGAARSTSRWEAAFNGCLWGARIGGVLLPFYKDETFLNNSNTERFLVVKKDASVGHDCAGRNQCGVGGPGHRYCGNGGQCVDEWNDFRCQCRLGYEGLQCETNPDNCVVHNCVNEVTCLDGEGDFTCVCLPGFTGVRCQTPVDQCQDNLCANGATCVDRGYDYTCDCSTAQDFTGWYCNVTVNQSCSTDLCQNGATCNTVGSSFECVCPSHYEGPLCERQKDVCSSNNNTLCQNGGTCLLNVSTSNGYTCHCDPDGDFEGADCADIINDCDGIDCGVDGTCVDDVRNYTCVCNKGLAGADCSVKQNVCTLNGPICQHGNCKDGTCECDPFYEGEGCDQDKNECTLPEPICKNDGVCTNKEKGFNCACTLGFRGDTCSEAYCDGLCKMGSTCETDGRTWRCNCPEFIEGQVCDTPGLCYYRPCEEGNYITCVQSIEYNNYTCNCKTGWQGQNCSEDIDECSTLVPSQKHQCVFGQGNCENSEGGYRCVCEPGYTGDFCQTDIDECETQPCLSGGTCTDRVNNFSCDCSDTGFQGLRCEIDIDECKSSPPVCNQGNCTNLAPFYTCQCGDRWRGQHCERENPCYNISCQHGGTCQENVTLVEERCSCASGYEGALCEKASRSSGGSSSDIGIIIGPIVAAVVLIIVIIVVIAFVMTARSKRATRGMYSPSAQENAGSRVENGGVLKKPPEERLI